MQQRNIGMAIVLTIVTCGLYGIYWFIQVTDDIKYLAGDNKTANGTTAFLLTLITCGIYGIYWAYVRGENVDTIKNQRGIPSSNSGILYVILNLIGFGIITYALLQSEINNTVSNQY